MVELLHRRGQDRVGVDEHHEGVAVGRRRCRALGADNARGTRLVLNQDRLAQRLRQAAGRPDAATKSVTPPGACGTISRIGLDGQVSALVGAAKTTNMADRATMNLAKTRQAWLAAHVLVVMARSPFRLTCAVRTLECNANIQLVSSELTTVRPIRHSAASVTWPGQQSAAALRTAVHRLWRRRVRASRRSRWRHRVRAGLGNHESRQGPSRATKPGGEKYLAWT